MLGMAVHWVGIVQFPSSSLAWRRRNSQVGSPWLDSSARASAAVRHAVDPPQPEEAISSMAISLQSIFGISVGNTPHLDQSRIQLTTSDSTV
jgi:hypothetical protein